MSKKLQLSIPIPCHENWEVMTPVEKGKFCGSCQKQVVDFSDMSDRQVAEFFKKPSTGSVCGRFMTDQLDRNIEIPKKRIPWVKYFFQFALPAFMISIKLSAQKTQGKINVNTVAIDTTRRPVFAEQNRTLGIVAMPDNFKPFMGDTLVKQIKEPVNPIKGDIKISADTAITEPVCSKEIMGTVVMPVQVNKNRIEGVVVDEKGEPVPFASISTGKPGEGVMADENGVFSINKSWLNKTAGFVVSSAGFETRRVIADQEGYSSGKLYVELKANSLLPEVVVNSGGEIMGKISMGGVRRITKEELTVTKTDTVLSVQQIKLPIEENGLLIYPNPVRSGATLNLSFKKIEEGYYQLQIINQSGQRVQQKEIWIDAEARLLSIDIPLVAAGSYFLILTNKRTGKKITEKIIVQ